MGSTIILGCALLIAGCSQQGRTDQMDSPRNVPPEHAVSEYDMERAETEKDLLDLRHRIDTRMSEVDSRLASTDVNDRQRAALMQYREDLQDRRNRLERARRDVDGSLTDNWENVRQATDNTMDDIGDWFERQGDRLEGIFSDEETMDEPLDD